LFVSFFTQLVAGPILRTSDLVPQLARPRTATADQLGWGLTLMTLGLFQKVVIADGALAPVADTVFGSKSVGFIDAWIGTLAFSGQIFCDFAGYSTIAIGAAMCLGFSIPDNFRAPYAALGFSDFWRRWHISLSSWLRDYLYVPLGGNRKGPVRTYINLFVTMLLGGLWHGANWTFVIWGGLHGAFLAVERWLRGNASERSEPRSLTSRLLWMLVTLLCVNLAWVFFRSSSIDAAFAMLAAMAGLNPQAAPVLPGIYIAETLLCMTGLLAAHYYMRNRTLEAVATRTPAAVLVSVMAAMAFVVSITQGSGDAFIYFQF
jgi:alginate O-acetyltransferase complex protein AlgI